MPRHPRLRTTQAALCLALAACKRPSNDAPAPAVSSSVAAPPASAQPSQPVASSSSAPPAQTARTRLAALAWETEVYERPDRKSKQLGYLRVGAVVEASDEPVGKGGCPGGWYAIKPHGHICAEAREATTDLQHELARALERRPDTTSRLPYIYGIVRRGTPVYRQLPTREQAEQTEPGLEAQVREWLSADGDNGAQFRSELWLKTRTPAEIEATPPPLALWEGKTTREVPWFLEGGRRPPTLLTGKKADEDGLVIARSKHHNGFAFLDTAVFEGRRYAITTSLSLVPVDRLRPIEGSSAKGYEIPGDINFPFAIVRAPGGALLREQDGKLVKVRDTVRREAIKLTGKQKFFGGRLHFETSDKLWVSDRYASRLDPAKKMPKWGKKGERWLDVNVTKQTLVAYDGTRAVFATLVSTGEAGLGDPETSRATKRGIFRIHTKHLTATMDSDVVGEEFELRDIPYVQYFEGGYALHAAYWHDDFGTPRSHGCINLAPEDARRIFFFTEPKLPDGWHGVRRPLTGSVVFVHP